LQTPAGAAPQSETGWQLPPLVTRPDFINRRPFIPDFLLKDRRFVRESAVLVNAELRWSIFDGGYVFGQHLRPMVAPIVDAGRVFDGTQLRFDGWRADYGIGFRLIWNLVTTASFDYGISSEGQIFQMALPAVV
jgi:hypothetical protein